MIKLQSTYKTYLWGGTKIRDCLKKETDLPCVAESWEVSTHPAGMSSVAEGEYAGKTLAEYFDAVGWDISGGYGQKYHRLPILVKYIDAHQNLSIQVHPDELYARAHENDGGKNEIWFVIGAERDAYLYLGFNRDMTQEEVRARIADNTLEDALNRVYVKTGDVFFIPAGTVHAIGAGCLICEIQQASDTTYRLYDYGRKEKNGQPRALHIPKALDVLDYKKYPLSEGIKGMGAEELFCRALPPDAHCSLFHYRADGAFTLALSAKKPLFAVTYAGEGELADNDGRRSTSVGDVWMTYTDSFVVKGKCEVLLIGI